MSLTVHQHSLVVLFGYLVFAGDQHRIEEAVDDVLVFPHFFCDLRIVLIEPLLAEFDCLHRVHRCKVEDVLADQLLHLDESYARADTPQVKEIAVVLLLLRIHYRRGDDLLTLERELYLAEPCKDISFYCLDLEEQRETFLEIALQLV